MQLLAAVSSEFCIITAGLMFQIAVTISVAQAARKNEQARFAPFISSPKAEFSISFVSFDWLGFY